MTKHQNAQADAPAATYESLMNALKGLHGKSEIRDALREFFKRNAATAKARSGDLHAGVTKATGVIESVLVKAVNGVAEVNRNVVDAAHQEIETAFSAVDKLIEAKSFDEAYRTYVNYLLGQNEVRVARAKSAASFVSAKASESFDALRDSAAKLTPNWLRAA